MARILRGLFSNLLPCGCLVGIYETYEGRVIALVDAKGRRCDAHATGGETSVAPTRELARPPDERLRPSGPQWALQVPSMLFRAHDAQFARATIRRREAEPGTHMVRLSLIVLIALVPKSPVALPPQDAPPGAQAPTSVASTTPSSKKMPDAKDWTTDNLAVETGGSYCYDDTELNCRRYGRLYSWDAARLGCQLLGAGWGLPSEDEWRQLAKHYGGTSDESDDGGRSAYRALLAGGSSGLNALLGGGRVSDKERYARLEAHGFYWTASTSDTGNAWFYNFGKGGLALHRQRRGAKEMALSVRCIRGNR